MILPTVCSVSFLLCPSWVLTDCWNVDAVEKLRLAVALYLLGVDVPHGRCLFAAMWGATPTCGALCGALRRFSVLTQC